MGPVQVDPDILDAFAYIVKSFTGSVDGVRLDLFGRTLTAALDDGVTSIRHAIEDLVTVAGAMLSDTRDEMAAMSEYLTLAADAVRKADGLLGPGGSP